VGANIPINEMSSAFRADAVSGQFSVGKVEHADADVDVRDGVWKFVR
jgi:hypothetical protein